MEVLKMVRVFVVSFAAVLLTTSQGFCGSPGLSRGMSSADIKGSSLERITAAATEVFTAEGYDIVKQGPEGMVFERPASRSTEIAYGGLQTAVIEQVVLGFQERNSGLFWVSCDAYMVKGRGGDPFFVSKDPVLRAFGREYRKLLKKVKAKAEAKPVNVTETETK